MDPFQNLRLPEDASRIDIKKAFHTLSLQCHPDKAGESSTLLFQHVAVAYDMLISGDYQPGIKTRMTPQRSKYDIQDYTREEFLQDLFCDLQRAKEVQERGRRADSGGPREYANAYPENKYANSHEDECPVCKEAPCNFFESKKATPTHTPMDFTLAEMAGDENEEFQLRNEATSSASSTTSQHSGSNTTLVVDDESKPVQAESSEHVSNQRHQLNDQLRDSMWELEQAFHRMEQTSQRLAEGVHRLSRGVQSMSGSVREMSANVNRISEEVDLLNEDLHLARRRMDTPYARERSPLRSWSYVDRLWREDPPVRRRGAPRRSASP